MPHGHILILQKNSFVRSDLRQCVQGAVPTRNVIAVATADEAHARIAGMRELDLALLHVDAGSVEGSAIIEAVQTRRGRVALVGQYPKAPDGRSPGIEYLQVPFTNATVTDLLSRAGLTGQPV